MNKNPPTGYAVIAAGALLGATLSIIATLNTLGNMGGIPWWAYLIALANTAFVTLSVFAAWMLIRTALILSGKPDIHLKKPQKLSHYARKLKTITKWKAIRIIVVTENT